MQRLMMFESWFYSVGPTGQFVGGRLITLNVVYAFIIGRAYQKPSHFNMKRDFSACVDGYIAIL